jgi:hypothetical protein
METLKGTRIIVVEIIEPSATQQLLAVPETEYESSTGRKGGTSVYMLNEASLYRINCPSLLSIIVFDIFTLSTS